jgi:hypothetical protein
MNHILTISISLISSNKCWMQGNIKTNIITFSCFSPSISQIPHYHNLPSTTTHTLLWICIISMYSINLNEQIFLIFSKKNSNTILSCYWSTILTYFIRLLFKFTILINIHKIVLNYYWFVSFWLIQLIIYAMQLYWTTVILLCRRGLYS